MSEHCQTPAPDSAHIFNRPGVGGAGVQCSTADGLRARGSSCGDPPRRHLHCQGCAAVLNRSHCQAASSRGTCMIRISCCCSQIRLYNTSFRVSRSGLAYSSSGVRFLPNWVEFFAPLRLCRHLFTYFTYGLGQAVLFIYTVNLGTCSTFPPPFLSVDGRSWPCPNVRHHIFHVVQREA